MIYAEVVQYLEALQMMPKTMPGLYKIRAALEKTEWFAGIDANKVIVVAGTNGKGTTCAALEALLKAAGQNVGFYSSPHLVSTTERIRVNAQNISENNFVRIFEECRKWIDDGELSHFEALTLMAGHYFFSGRFLQADLDFVIFEVGLGGSFDATNAFPHKYNIITKLGLDHTSILGPTLGEVAKNKFGIVGRKSIVVHQPVVAELESLKNEIRRETNSNWIEAEPVNLSVKPGPRYFLNYAELAFEINIPGKRAAENIMTAITMFQVLGFDLHNNQSALNKIAWQGRMQQVQFPGMRCPLFLSGDHNEQGVDSLIEILNDFKWKTLHLVVGIGADKSFDKMLSKLIQLKGTLLYLTETPFKGLGIAEYPSRITELAVEKNKDVEKILQNITKKAEPEDLCIVTGSLYLVGKVLGLLPLQ